MYNKTNFGQHNQCLCGRILSSETWDPDSIYCSITCARADALAALTAPEDLTYTRASHYRRVSSKQELQTKAKEASLADVENDNQSYSSQKSGSRHSHWKKARQILFGSPGSSDESNPDEKRSKGRVLRRKSKSYSSLNPSKQTKSPPKPLGEPKLKLKQATRQQSESSDEELKPPPLPPKPAKIPLGARHKRVPAIIKIPGRDVEFAHSRNGSTASEAQTTASSATTTTTFQTETTATTAPSSLILDTPVLSSKRASLKDRESLASRITFQQSPETTPVPAKVDTTPIATEAPVISLNTSDSTLMRSPSSSNTIALNRARSKAMRDRAKRLSLAKSSNNLLQVASNQSLTKSLHQSQSCSTFKSATTSTSRQTFESAFDGTNPADYSPSPTWEYDDIYNSNSNLRQTEENENTKGLLPLQPINEAVPPLVDYDLNWFMQHSTSYKSIKLAANGGGPSAPPSTPQAMMHHNDTVTKRNVSNSHSVTDQNELEDLDDSVKQALLMADDVLAFS